MSSASVTLRGTVSPLEGGPCRVALLDDKEQEWPIFPRGAGADLAEMVRPPVDLPANVMEEGHKQIDVRPHTFLAEDDNESCV